MRNVRPAVSFESLAACEAACPSPECPPVLPDIGTACDSSTRCDYDPFSGCLCGDRLASPCTRVDPTCTGTQAREVPAGGSAGACTDCPAEIVIPQVNSCLCNATWMCSSFK